MTSSAMTRMSGSAIANAMVDFRRRSFRIRSGAHEALKFGGGPGDRLVDRFPTLRAPRHHLGRDGLAVDLLSDPWWRGECRDRQGLAGFRRIVVQRAFGWAFLGPGLEIAQLGERRDVVTLTCGNHLLDRGA